MMPEEERGNLNLPPKKVWISRQDNLTQELHCDDSDDDADDDVEAADQVVVHSLVAALKKDNSLDIGDT